MTTTPTSTWNKISTTFVYTTCANTTTNDSKKKVQRHNDRLAHCIISAQISMHFNWTNSQPLVALIHPPLTSIYLHGTLICCYDKLYVYGLEETKFQINRISHNTFIHKVLRLCSVYWYTCVYMCLIKKLRKWLIHWREGRMTDRFHELFSPIKMKHDTMYIHQAPNTCHSSLISPSPGFAHNV